MMIPALEGKLNQAAVSSAQCHLNSEGVSGKRDFVTGSQI